MTGAGNQRLPVIAVTRLPLDGRREVAMQMGAHECLRLNRASVLELDLAILKAISAASSTKTRRE